jgi:hypothetical protein
MEAFSFSQNLPRHLYSMENLPVNYSAYDSEKLYIDSS